MVRVTSPSAVDRSWHHGWAETISVGVGAVPAPLSQKRWAWPVKASMAQAAQSGEDASHWRCHQGDSQDGRASMSCAVMCSGQSEMAALGPECLALPICRFCRAVAPWARVRPAHLAWLQMPYEPIVSVFCRLSENVLQFSQRVKRGWQTATQSIRVCRPALAIADSPLAGRRAISRQVSAKAS